MSKASCLDIKDNFSLLKDEHGTVNKTRRVYDVLKVFLYRRRQLISPEFKKVIGTTERVKQEKLSFDSKNFFYFNGKVSTISVSSRIQEVAWARCVRLLVLNITVTPILMSTLLFYFVFIFCCC